MRAFVVSRLVVFYVPSQEISLEKGLQSDLFCGEWDVKPQRSQSVISLLVSVYIQELVTWAFHLCESAVCW